MECEVVNLRSIRPLDTNTVTQSVMKTNNLVTVEFGWHTGGVGSEVIAAVIEGKSLQLLIHIFLRYLQFTCTVSVIDQNPPS